MLVTVSKLSDVCHQLKNTIRCILYQAAHFTISCSYRIFNTCASTTWDVVVLFTCWDAMYVCSLTHLIVFFWSFQGSILFNSNVATLSVNSLPLVIICLYTYNDAYLSLGSPERCNKWHWWHCQTQINIRS